MTDAASAPAIPAPASETMPAGIPYAPSALNRFYDAAERLPGGGWWAYAGLFFALVAWNEVGRWLTGVAPAGSLTFDGVLAMLYGPYALGAGHVVLRSVAPRAIEAFRPASGMTDETYALRRYELLTLPAGPFWAATVVGAVVGLATIVGASPEGLAPFGGTVPAALVILGPGAVLGYGMTAVGVHLSVRELRFVQRFHREATAIDPFDVGPIYAFSRLTSVIGASFVLASYYALLTNWAYQAGNLVGLAAIAGSIAAGVACFIVPLWGIHGRLVDAKAELVRQGSVRAQALQERLYRQVDDGDLAGAKDIGDALAAVRATTERIEKLPTWPWPPQVLRGFLSAILLPVIVYLITRYVGTQLL